MPKLKMPRSSPSIDMTPMVDLAFLLVTFFMLTANFRPEEAVAVDTPTSSSESPIPLDNLMTIIVDSTGKVFWDMTDKGVRLAVLDELAKRVSYTPTAEDKAKFATVGPIGMELNHLRDFLELHSAAERKEFNKRLGGIPCDTTRNELSTWIAITRSVFFNSAKTNVLVALKGDGNTNYSKISQVIRTFQAQTPPVSRFKMITDLGQSRM